MDKWTPSIDFIERFSLSSTTGESVPGKKQRNMVDVNESGNPHDCWRMSIIYLDDEPDIHQGTLND